MDLKLSNYSTTAAMNGSIASANNATLATVAANYGLKTVVDQHSLDIAARITPLEVDTKVANALLGAVTAAALASELASRDASISGLQASKADASALTAYALQSAVDTSSDALLGKADASALASLLSTVDGLDTPLQHTPLQAIPEEGFRTPAEATDEDVRLARMRQGGNRFGEDDLAGDPEADALTNNGQGPPSITGRLRSAADGAQAAADLIGAGAAGLAAAQAFRSQLPQDAAEYVRLNVLPRPGPAQPPPQIIGRPSDVERLLDEAGQRAQERLLERWLARRESARRQRRGWPWALRAAQPTASRAARAGSSRTRSSGPSRAARTPPCRTCGPPTT